MTVLILSLRGNTLENLTTLPYNKQKHYDTIVSVLEFRFQRRYLKQNHWKNGACVSGGKEDPSTENAKAFQQMI